MFVVTALRSVCFAEQLASSNPENSRMHVDIHGIFPLVVLNI
jgi:hypothetical protein